MDKKGVVHDKAEDAIESGLVTWRLKLRIGLNEEGVHRLSCAWKSGVTLLSRFEIESWTDSLLLLLLLRLLHEDGEVHGGNGSKRRRRRLRNEGSWWTCAARVRVRG